MSPPDRWEWIKNVCACSLSSVEPLRWSLRLARGSSWGNTYTVQVALPSATNIIDGGTVQLNGFTAGSVSDIEASDNQAIVTLKINSEYAPLHEGAQVVVPWKALLGERLVEHHRWADQRSPGFRTMG